MRYKFVILTVFFISFWGEIMAQSKKEQILILSNKVDSLNSVLNNERSLSLEKITKLNSEIDLISKKLIAANDELIKVSKECENLVNELESLSEGKKTIESELTILKDENSILEFRLDSLDSVVIAFSSIPKFPEMIFVKGGAFQMGSNYGNDDEMPVHTVKLNSFYIGKYEVAQYQWTAIMGNNPSQYRICDNCPVNRVSWSDVHEYIRKLNAQTGKKYRLPTEAEWEYAAKGGVYSKGYRYSGSDDIEEVGWYSDNSNIQLHCVGEKQPNELGIYDMTGNLEEWCSDWFGNYRGGIQVNPRGAASGKDRVFRGGCYFASCDDYVSRVTQRAWVDPEYRNGNVGFRLVLTDKP